MNLATGGATPISMNFGFGSYNFTSGEFNYLGKKGNKWYENVGFGLGALGNLGDVVRIVDHYWKYEQRMIDEMQNYPPNGPLDENSIGENLWGYTYSGPEKNGPITLGPDPIDYFGPIPNPNWVDAAGFRHDIWRKFGMGYESRGFRQLVSDPNGNSGDWLFVFDNLYCGSKHLLHTPLRSMSGLANAAFFIFNKTITQTIVIGSYNEYKFPFYLF
jgi:hypothetical protein